MDYENKEIEQISVDNYQFIVNTLKGWGITLYTGVTGGGVIHFLKHLFPFYEKESGNPEFLTLGEYSAGFVPLGHYLANGKIAVAVATTGAATKLLSCGLSDAKFHDVPALYIVPVSGKDTAGFSPLQDSSVYGNNIVEQLRAELPDAVFVLDDLSILPEQLLQVKSLLDNSKPAVLVLANDVLNGHAPEFSVLQPIKQTVKTNSHFNSFVTDFRSAVNGKRLVILVGEEMTRYPDAVELTTLLSNELRAAVIWSINGANAVSRENPYGYGYISFGGNDKALSIYNSLGKDDVFLVLGACPDEYTANFNKYTAFHTFYLSNISQAYGMVNGSMQHVAEGKFTQVQGPIDESLRRLIEASYQHPFSNQPVETAPAHLNDHPFPLPAQGYVDMVTFYQRMDKWWPEDSIGFDDVCLAYKDRQYVTQRPNNNIRFFSLYRGSAMGGIFGTALGAKLADPDQHVFFFTGDGCFRLFSGSLGEASNLGLVMFLLNNKTLSIVEQGLEIIFPDVSRERYHAWLNPIDYCGIAKASGWDAEKLTPDLSTLDGILDKIKRGLSRSLLIEIPVDPLQFLGSNPRLKNL